MTSTNFSNCVDSGSDDLSANTRVNEFLGKFPDDRSKDVGWSKIMDGLSEGHEDEGNLELMIGEVSD